MAPLAETCRAKDNFQLKKKSVKCDKSYLRMGRIDYLIQSDRIVTKIGWQSEALLNEGSETQNKEVLNLFIKLTIFLPRSMWSHNIFTILDCLKFFTLQGVDVIEQIVLLFLGTHINQKANFTYMG